MDFVLDHIADLSRWSRSHLDEVALAVTATLLVLFGSQVNGFIQARLGSLPTAVRVPAFALACLALYGAAMTFLTPWVVKGLAQFNNYALAPVLLIGVCLLGVLAERRS